MIRVTKRDRAPAILRKRGALATTKLQTQFDANASAYCAGTAKWTFDGSLYAAKSVKNALIHDQRGKCCFCESRMRSVSYGDVEHFRPKAGWKQAAGDTLVRPGYYWLAYSWSNLYLSCQICNQQHKGNLFPLADESTRALNHHGDVSAEQLLWVDPADSPGEHIGFRGEIAHGKTPVGETSVHGFGLNREQLLERRREHLKMTQLLESVVALLGAKEQHDESCSSLLAESARALAQRCSETAEFSAMTQSRRPSGRTAVSTTVQ